jgi:hypothetical protein
VIIGVVCYYLILAGTEVPIRFDPEPTDTAVYEQGRPLKRTIIATGAGAAYHQESKAVGAHPEPDSGNRGIYGIAKEYHGKLFNKTNSASENSA